MSVRETFSNSIELTVINGYGKVLWSRFQQCLCTFTVLLFEGLSETGLNRHWPKQVFAVRNGGNTKALRVFFFQNIQNFNADFKKAEENFKKFSCFWENCIWIGIVKLSLLRTGYLLLAANVSTSSPRFYMSMRGTFSNSVFFPVTNEFEKGAVMEISTVLWQVYDIAFPGVLWNWTI